MSDTRILVRPYVIGPTDTSFVVPAVTNNTALDGFNNGNNSGTGSVVLTLTTTKSNDIIVVFAAINSQGGDPTVSGGGLTWGSKRSTTFTGAGSGIWEFTAVAASPLSGVSITIAPFSDAYTEVCIFGISGANTSSFDTGGPQTTTGTSVAITTANANDFVFYSSRTSSGTISSGFTQIGTGVFQITGYQIVTVTNTYTATDSNSNGMIIDAAKST